MGFHHLTRRLASPKLTVACLLGSLVLVFLATVDQVSHGLYYVIKKYFQSFLITVHIGGVPIPYFPGGYLLAALMLLNLLGAYVVYFKINYRKMALFILHAGLVLFIAGEAFNLLFTEESQMAIKVGEEKNFSEIPRKIELTIIDKSNKEFDLETVIPENLLVENAIIVTSSLPFTLKIKKIYSNAEPLPQTSSTYISAKGELDMEKYVKPLPEITDDENLNNFTLIAEAVEGKKSLGLFLLARELLSPGILICDERQYELRLRPKRIYYPFKIALVDFKKELYPGTDIPKSFKSEVRIFNAENELDREAEIYMNHPLYYRGKTFYQASFGDNDTLSIFQVVDNPFWSLPYMASVLVAGGMLLQFILKFFRAGKR